MEVTEETILYATDARDLNRACAFCGEPANTYIPAFDAYLCADARLALEASLRSARKWEVRGGRSSS